MSAVAVEVAHSHDARRIALLLEHVVAFEDERIRPSARDRLEWVIGGYLARLLVGALTRERGPHAR
jgi:hypothetical protein